MYELAIVIPAYKETYLERTLSSLAVQTRKDFTVYIGDDYSPYNLKKICDSFTGKLDIKYTRFENNIGAKNLVNQWSRCVGLTKNEEWIWLFSDDDLVDPNCVESFYNQKNSDNGLYDIYRFNTIVIDGDNNLKWKTPEAPSFESSEVMAYNLLLGKRGNSLADHIFSRDIYIKSNGLVFTEYAQGADWAMSILFSKYKGLSTIPGANFYWRYSGSNISSSTGKTRSKMLRGHIQFINWITCHFEYLHESKKEISYDMIIKAARVNLNTVITYHYKEFPINDFTILFKLMHSRLKMGYTEIFKDFFTIFKCTNKGYNFLAHIKNVIKTQILKQEPKPF